MLNVFIGFRNNSTKPWMNVWLFIFKFILTHQSMLRTAQYLYLNGMTSGISSPPPQLQWFTSILQSYAPDGLSVTLLFSDHQMTRCSSFFKSQVICDYFINLPWYTSHLNYSTPISHFNLFYFIFTALFLLNHFVHLFTSLLALPLYCPFILNFLLPVPNTFF